jgi:hypothetical protein
MGLTQTYLGFNPSLKPAWLLGSLGLTQTFLGVIPKRTRQVN